MTNTEIIKGLEITCDSLSAHNISSFWLNAAIQQLETASKRTYQKEVLGAVKWADDMAELAKNNSLYAPTNEQRITKKQIGKLKMWKTRNKLGPKQMEAIEI